MKPRLIENAPVKIKVGAISAVPIGCLIRNARIVVKGVLIFSLCVFALVVSARGQSLGEPQSKLPALISQGSLDPRLPREITRLKFSPDGNFILAQDSSTIFVLMRQPFAEHFRIDAPDAGPAEFTPDSSEVAFSTGGPRLSVERWNVAKGERTSAHAVVLVGDCLESVLSPDGKSLACFSEHASTTARIAPFKVPVALEDIDFELIDVTSGDVIAQKKDFIVGTTENSGLLFDAWKIAQSLGSLWNSSIPASFSPDGRYFIAGFDRASVAVDLVARALIPLHGDLAWILSGGFTFISPERVLAENFRNPEKSEILEIPSGLVISPIALGNQRMEAATRGSYVFLRPIKSAPLGVFDWASRKMIAAVAEPAGVDIYGQQMVVQMTDGEIALSSLAGAKLESRLALPPGNLGTLEASAVSTDLRWLAISTPSRGAIWGLSSKQHYLLRGFHGAYFEGEDAFYADFPKRLNVPRAIVRASLESVEPKPIHDIDNSSMETKQYGPFLVSKIAARTSTANSTGKGSWNFSLSVQDARDGHTLWTQTFPEVTPGDIEVSTGQNRVIFRWLAEEKPAMSAIKNAPALKARYTKIRDHIDAYLFQVREAETGKDVGDVLVDSTSLGVVTHSGLTIPPTAFASGDALFVSVNPEQTRVYSVSTGDLKATVPGSGVAASPKARMFAIGQGGDLQLYTLPNAERGALLAFPSPTCFVRFSGDGKRLFVLTQDQNFYVFDTEILARPGSRQPAQ